MDTEKKHDPKRKLEDQLNEAARRLKSENSTQADWASVWSLALKLVDKENDPSVAVIDAISECIEKYGPEKGDFSNYLYFLVKRRKNTEYRKNQPLEQSVSLDTPVGEDGSSSLGDVTPDENAVSKESRIDEESRIDTDGYFAELISMVLNFSQRHTGKANNSSRRKWYRIFFTEDMTLVCKEHKLKYVHERDIFQAMLLPYLDFYMDGVCRTGQEIFAAPLKAYEEIDPAHAGEKAPPRLPLPADVSLSYLNTVEGVRATKPGRSNYLKFYREDKETIFQC